MSTVALLTANPSRMTDRGYRSHSIAKQLTLGVFGEIELCRSQSKVLDARGLMKILIGPCGEIQTSDRDFGPRRVSLWHATHSFGQLASPLSSTLSETIKRKGESEGEALLCMHTAYLSSPQGGGGEEMLNSGP